MSSSPRGSEMKVLHSPTKDNITSEGETHDQALETHESKIATREARKMASLQSKIATLHTQIAETQAQIAVIAPQLKNPDAAATVQKHIKLLHTYNEIRDIGTGLMGMIADTRGVRVKDVYEEFGVGMED